MTPHPTLTRWILLCGGLLLLGASCSSSSSVSGDPDNSTVPSVTIPEIAEGELTDPVIPTPIPTPIPTAAPTSAPAPTQTPTPQPVMTPRPTFTPTPTTSPRILPSPTPGAGSADTSLDARGAEILRLTNIARSEQNVLPLEFNRQLTQAAQLHAEDMAKQGYFSHVSLDGRDLSARVRATGYFGSAIGENIARGYSDPARIMDLWMQSPGHRSNILNSTFEELGVGVATSSSGTVYWVQVFGR